MCHRLLLSLCIILRCFRQVVAETEEISAGDGVAFIGTLILFFETFCALKSSIPEEVKRHRYWEIQSLTPLNQLSISALGG